jgi:hypothetical protein
MARGKVTTGENITATLSRKSFFGFSLAQHCENLIIPNGSSCAKPRFLGILLISTWSACVQVSSKYGRVDGEIERKKK